jgi:hypothetical protein
MIPFANIHKTRPGVWCPAGLFNTSSIRGGGNSRGNVSGTGRAGDASQPAALILSQCA